jgi:hypothetical protein
VYGGRPRIARSAVTTRTWLPAALSSRPTATRNGDARVVHIVQPAEVEHGHISDPLIEEGLDGAGQFYGRGKP